jgi:hypothetical protein
VNFAFFVEGPTERALSAFFKRWLDPQLTRPVGVKPVRFRGSGDFTKSFAQRARRDLASSQLIAVVGLLDLYDAGLQFPPALTTDAKYIWAKAQMENQVRDPRFLQHFAVHETEAWLLSDPAIFPDKVRAHVEASKTDPNPSISRSRRQSS